MKTGLKRNTIDKFYTKNCVINDIFKTIEGMDLFKEDDLIIEPSAGNGAFLDNLKDYNYMAYDIQPEDERIQKQDFLTLDIKTDKDIHFIGNPPFGRQSSLAKRFIKHCISFKNTKSISFILPLSFKKLTMNKVFGKHFHLVYEKTLDKKSFYYDNNDYDIPCVFQIWKYDTNERVLKQNTKCDIFDWIHKNNKDKSDFAIRRVGGNAGVITDKVLEVSDQSYYYIKLKQINKKDFLDIYKTIEFTFDNTFGPKSINKAEFCNYIKLKLNNK